MIKKGLIELIVTIYTDNVHIPFRWLNLQISKFWDR